MSSSEINERRKLQNQARKTISSLITPLKTNLTILWCKIMLNATGMVHEAHLYVNIVSYNGLLPGWHQAIIRINAGILFIGPLGTFLLKYWSKFKHFNCRKYVSDIVCGCCPFHLDPIFKQNENIKIIPLLMLKPEYFSIFRIMSQIWYWLYWKSSFTIQCRRIPTTWQWGKFPTILYN